MARFHLGKFEIDDIAYKNLIKKLEFQFQTTKILIL
jgi:hypothetical protein